MHTGTAGLLFSILLGLAPAVAAEERAYSLGVRAYQAKDYAAARVHWAKAVEQKERLALNNLGFLLYEGPGGPADPAAAVKLWMQGARLGNDETQWHLAQAYEAGKGTPRNLAEAYAWYRCAVVSYANASAADKQDREIAGIASASALRVIALLPEAELVAAERLARHYVQKFARKP